MRWGTVFDSRHGGANLRCRRMMPFGRKVHCRAAGGRHQAGDGHASCRRRGLRQTRRGPYSQSQYTENPHNRHASVATSLDAIEHSRPVSLVRFAPMAAAGAAALGVIFGAPNLLTLAMIAVVTGVGACLRRALSHLSSNPFVQPLLAAFLAGVAGGGVMALGLAVSYRLVLVCPCMILVPGPHFLNGMIDLAHGRIPLGMARFTFAGLVVVAICAGLLAGCACSGATLPIAGAAAPVPVVADVAAAGLAVAAYGTFFNMPWRMLLMPIGIGMLAHALRWELLQVGASIQLATFSACLLVGAVVAPAARRFRIPFGAFAFAAIVSMIPGAYMFQCAAEAMNLIGGTSEVLPDALTGVFRNGATACVILLAMTFGLLIAKMGMDYVLPRPAPHR